MKRAIRTILLGSGRGPRVRLSGASVSETASIADDIGTLSVTGATGTPTFSLVDDAGGLFALNGAILEVAGALDYETATSHQITVSVSGMTPTVPNRTFTITVTDVEEGGGDAPTMNFSIAANSQLLVLLEDF